MKFILAAVLAFTALPALAQEGNGDPFPLNVPGVTTYITSRQLADGSTVTQFSQAPVQTVEALPLDSPSSPPTYAAVQDRARQLASAQR